MQANEMGPPTLVGTWEKSARQLYLEFLESPKISKIPDEEVRTLTAVCCPPHCFLRRDARANTHTGIRTERLRGREEAREEEISPLATVLFSNPLLLAHLRGVLLDAIQMADGEHGDHSGDDRFNGNRADA